MTNENPSSPKEGVTLQQCKEEIVKKLQWESYREFYLIAGFPAIITVNDQAAELYASKKLEEYRQGLAKKKQQTNRR